MPLHLPFSHTKSIIVHSSGILTSSTPTTDIGGSGENQTHASSGKLYGDIREPYAVRAAYELIKALVDLERLGDGEAEYASLRKQFPNNKLLSNLAIVLFNARGTNVAAIEEDGAEVIIFGCGGAFWLQPFLQRRLDEIGWEVPVLDGYSCAIVLAKAMVDLGVDASGLFLPSDRPKKWRRKKVF